MSHSRWAVSVVKRGVPAAGSSLIVDSAIMRPFVRTKTESSIGAPPAWRGGVSRLRKRARVDEHPFDQARRAAAPQPKARWIERPAGLFANLTVS